MSLKPPISPTSGALSVLETLDARIDDLEAETGSIFSVTDPSYGATGDGVADDTAEIQAAIDACGAAGGGVVYFPEGTYLVSSTLTVDTSKTILRGAGWGSKLTGTAAAVDPMIKLDVVRECVIENLFLQGWPTTGGGIWVLAEPDDGQGAESDNYIRNCHIRYFATYQIQIGDPTSGGEALGTHVFNCRIRATNPDDAIGIANYSADNIIAYNRIQADSGTSLLLDSKSAGGGGTQVFGNHFFSAQPDASVVPLGVRLRGGNITLIQGNYFDNFRQGPSLTIDPPTGQASRDIDISKNIFLCAANFRDAGDTTNVDDDYPMIDIDTSGGGTVEGVVIQGNVGHGPATTSRWSYVLSMTSGTAAVTLRDNEIRNVVALYDNAPAITEGNLFHNGTAWSIGTKPIILTVGDFAAQTGSPVTGSSGNGRGLAWQLDAAADEVVATTLVIPESWTKVNIIFWWENPTSSSGDVRWQAIYGGFAGDESLNTGDTTTSVTATAGAQYLLKKTTIASSVAVTPGELFRLRAGRDADNVADTLGNDIGLLAVQIEQAP